MTPRQRELARHALGLPNRNRRSYRNRFSAFPASEDHRCWLALAMAGLACVGGDGEMDFFWLTRAGAEAALERGERLCREDFPPLPCPRDARGRYASQAAEEIAA